MDNSLTISGTIELDTGKYTCVADTDLDSDEVSAQLVVQGREHCFFEVTAFSFVSRAYVAAVGRAHYRHNVMNFR